jgi:hypothetical protein
MPPQIGFQISRVKAGTLLLNEWILAATPLAAKSFWGRT